MADVPWQLTKTVPARSAPVTSAASERSAVHTDALSPKDVSLAWATASSMSR
jgi:hypothetical protein